MGAFLLNRFIKMIRKVTVGITALFARRVRIYGQVSDLDVGLGCPLGVAA